MPRLTHEFSLLCARSIGNAALLSACLGCVQVLGIPTDPELAQPESQTATRSMSDGDRGPASATPEAPAADDARGVGPDGAARPDGVLPPGSVGGIDAPPSPDRASSAPDGPLEPAPGAADAGATDAGGAQPEPACVSGRRPVDVVLIVDNSGSMGEETAAIEQALPSFVERLDRDAVDHRVILLSRHRADDRSESEEASTSLCVAAPVSGLSTCPSERPALGARFFHYSVKIDDDDSLTRALETYSEPDAFALTARGWSEWLRPGALTIFIELTDSDSALGAGAFVAALQASDPERFGSDPAQPGFVFHAVTGIIEKALSADIYFADEPIQTAVCSGAGSNPDDAGVVYQELSRLTGGVRLSICPAEPFTLRLAALAADVALRSALGCGDQQ